MSKDGPQLTFLMVPGFASTKDEGTMADLINELRQRGHLVYYACSERGKLPLGKFDDYPDVIVEQALALLKRMHGLNLTNVVGVGHSLGALVLAAASLIEPKRFKRIDLLCPPSLYPQGLLGLGVNFVIKATQDVISSLWHRNPQVRRLTRQLLRTAGQYMNTPAAMRRAWREVRAMTGEGVGARMVQATNVRCRVILATGDSLFANDRSSSQLANLGKADIVHYVNAGHDAHYHSAIVAKMLLNE